MPCYHFNVSTDHHLDHGGAELSDLNAAHVEAVRLAADVLREQPTAFWAAKDWRLDVCNCSGEVIFGLRLTCFSGPQGVTADDVCPVEA